MMFALAVFAVAVLSGGTAAVVGFGIGSMLTPLIASRLGMETAVALVAVPHAVATAIRCWRLRASIDWGVMRGFGVLSACGGLLGALIYAVLDSRQLARVLGALLVTTAVVQLSGLASRWHPRGVVVALLGLGSGLFGGLAGNQGGLRAAALSAFDLRPLAFVATSTAIGLMVDAARTPVYVALAWRQLWALWFPIAVATLGVVIGTVLGERILLGLPRATFTRVVAVAIGILGIWLLS